MDATVSRTPVMDRWIQRTVDTHVPWSVHLDLTYRCNERCIHCYLDHEDYGEMTTDEVKGVLEQLAEAGTLFLTLSGGELFLRADLFELIEFARCQQFDVSLKTNALLVTPERARRLRKLAVRSVQVSIYSAEPGVHDAITKVRGSLERSLAGIQLLLAEGIQVKLACPLMKQNLTAYRGVQALAADLGVPYVLDLTITPKMDGDMSLLALRNSAQELLPVIQDASLGALACGDETPRPREFALVTGSVVSSGLEAAERAMDDDIPCCAGQNSCYISPYGDVYPCVQMPLATGNVRKQSFQEIWLASPEMNRVRAVRESNLPVCSTCAIRSYCERCPGLALMEGGDMLGAYERACELAELKARVAGVRNPVSAAHAMNAAAREAATAAVPVALA